MKGPALVLKAILLLKAVSAGALPAQLEPVSNIHALLRTSNWNVHNLPFLRGQVEAVMAKVREEFASTNVYKEADEATRAQAEEYFQCVRE
jgi:cell shape-determining protein MreC